jgi:sulfite exporter TauE/SafE
MAGPIKRLPERAKLVFAMMWSALVLGFMGSVHCLAMCGPLVMTLNTRKQQSISDKLLYNAGRIFTYCLLGLIAGIFGSGIQWAIGQQFLSVTTGVLLLLAVLVGWIGKDPNVRWLSGPLAKIKMKLGAMLNGNRVSMWWFGVYNGFLPCGLTYVALAASVATGSLLQSIVYMALFGLGTSPMMWVIVSGFQKLNQKWISGNKLITGFTCFLALLLIVRGLGLGVPYLSPSQHEPHHHHEINK